MESTGFLVILPFKNCWDAGIKKAVVFSSHFVSCHRRWPELRLSGHCPYIRSRLEQIRNVFLDTEYSRKQLGYEKGNHDKALENTVRACIGRTS